MKIVEPSVTLVTVTPDAERVIERLGRLCWKSEDRVTEGSAGPFIRMIKSKQHASVLEHASASFIIGCDRGVSHELVRHRLASYSQTSTRYCNYGQDRFGSEISVIKPSSLDPNSIAFSLWLRSCAIAENSYLSMLEHDCSPQVARSVLPTCLYTEVGTTMNFREWLHFLDLRTSPAAHPDMRVIALMVQAELVRVAPSVFSKEV